MMGQESVDRQSLEKYRSWRRYVYAWVTRALLRTILKTTATWTTVTQPTSGYTIVVGVPHALGELVDIPLQSIARSSLTHCDEVLLCIDATEQEVCKSIGPAFVRQISARFPTLTIRVLFYTHWQRWIARAIDWNWVDCWLTWVIGIAAARSRWVMLHDFDAIVADHEFIETHYRLAKERRVIFAGIQPELAPVPNGVRTLVMTIELMIDAHHIKSTYDPVHLFNRVRLSGGLRIECDILRDIQLNEPPDRCLLHSICEEQVIHPSQLVSQWRKLRKRSGHPFRPQGYTPLLAIPYFRFLGGDAYSLKTLTRVLRLGAPTVELEGGSLSLLDLDLEGLDWIAKQVDRMNDYFPSSEPDVVKEYTAAIRNYQPLRQEPS